MVFVRMNLSPSGSVKNISDGNESMGFIGGDWSSRMTAGVFNVYLRSPRLYALYHIGFLLDLSDGMERMSIYSGNWTNLQYSGVFSLYLTSARVYVDHRLGFR